jgi:hypothetical protein
MGNAHGGLGQPERARELGSGRGCMVEGVGVQEGPCFSAAGW